MHDTARLTGKAFFDVYGTTDMKILDVGSCNVNGTLREFAPKEAQYTGVDLEPGDGVDMVVKPGHFPFHAETFTHTVSTSCFEHDPFFWDTFREMARVTVRGGFIYLSAPSVGQYHAYPRDFWRFNADAGLALEAWVNRARVSSFLVLKESFLLPPQGDVYTDFVAVFQNGGEGMPNRIHPLFPTARDIRGPNDAIR